MDTVVKSFRAYFEPIDLVIRFIRRTKKPVDSGKPQGRAFEEAHVKESVRGWEGRVTPLGQWLPRKRRLRRFLNRELLVVIVFFLFTLTIFMVGDRMPEPYNLSLSSLISIALGAAIGIWWEKSIADKKARIDAMSIDTRIEEEMQRTSEHWRQTILALTTLIDKPDTEFIRATQYLLGTQVNYVEGTLQRYALEVDRLGFDSGAFLDEKRERFIQLKMKVLEVLKTMPRENDLLIQIFSKIDPETFVLPPHELEKVLENKNLEIIQQS